MRIKRNINENIFDSARRFTDAFFDSLAAGASEKVINTAKKKGLPDSVVRHMEEVQKDVDALRKELAKLQNKRK